MRLRVEFTKFGKIRFTSHRDVARMWERAIRRAELPISYSEGFNPRPKMSFGLALSTCHQSDAEYIDLEIDPQQASTVAPDSVADLLTQHLPDGLEAVRVVEIDRKTPSLQQAVTSCTWQIDVIDTDEETAAAAVARALAAEELIMRRQRKGKDVVDDLRPQLINLEIIGPIITGPDISGPNEEGVRMVAELGTKPRSVRPSELLAALEPPLTEWRVTRLNQWITDDDGSRREPIPRQLSSSAPLGAT